MSLTWEYGPHDWVTYIGCTDSQAKAVYDTDDPRKCGLVVGEKYQVSSVELSSSWSRVALADFFGYFNTVCFEYHSKGLH